MKLNLILSSEEIEDLIQTHIIDGNYDTEGKDLNIDFTMVNSELVATINIEDSVENQKPNRIRRTKEQMAEDANSLTTIDKPSIVLVDAPIEPAPEINEEEEEDLPKTSGIFN
jgi:hypothetical protein